MTPVLSWLAAGLLLVLVGLWPPLAGYLAQLLSLALGLLLTGAVALLSQPVLLAVAVGAVLVIRRVWRPA
ncbi:hypothetical protein ACFY1J_31030 [Streptomyces sp. NPDC001406]|uniref:hypothetical protein n=1 Tax=Streptomyces sp. NPDC001406 TaxID=3364572 RepID=UPI0036C47686